MDLFNKVSDTVIRTGKTVGRKAKDAGNVTKLNYEIYTREEEVKKIFFDLGKRYYEAHKDEDPGDEAKAFERIGRLKEEIADRKAEVRAIKGVSVCPKCGTEIRDGAKFCSECGADLTPFAEEDKED